MVNKRKAGEEALKEILLRMSYDLGKTLNENKSLLKEAPTIKNNIQSPSLSLNQSNGSNIFAQYEKDRNKLIELYKDKPFPFERPQRNYRFADPKTNITHPRDNTNYNPPGFDRFKYSSNYSEPTKITGEYYLYRGEEMSVDKAMNQYKKDKEDWLSVNYGPSPYPGYFKHAFRGEDADDKKEKQEKLLSRIEKYRTYDEYLDDINNPKNHTYEYDGMEEDLKKMGSYVKDYINYMSNDPDIAMVQQVKEELKYRIQIADREAKRQCDEYIVKQQRKTNNSSGNKKLSQQEQDNLLAWLKKQPGFENATGFADSSAQSQSGSKSYLSVSDRIDSNPEWFTQQATGHHTKRNFPKSAVIDVTQKTRDELNASVACSRIKQELYDDLGVTELQKIIDSLGSDLKNHEEYLDALESETTHKILGYGALAFAILGMMVQVVTGGTTTPLIGGLTLRGLSFAASTLLGVSDAALYASEGNTRMAIFVGLLSALDASAVAGSLKSIRATTAEVQVIGDKITKLVNSRRIGTTTLEKEFTKRELEILATAGGHDANALRILMGEAKILSKESLKLAAKDLRIFAQKSPKYFLSALTKFSTYINLSKIFLVIDGMQISYNAIYDAISGEDKKLQSLTLLLIEHYFNDGNVNSQIAANNVRIEDEISKLNQLDAILFWNNLISAGVTTEENSLSLDEMKKYYDSIPTPNLNKKEVEALPGAFKDYIFTNKPVPFKTKEEGDKFRVWFNENMPEMSKILQLDKTGSFNNQYIKRAYNIDLGGKTVGNEYMDFINNPQEDPESISTDGWN